MSEAESTSKNKRTARALRLVPFTTAGDAENIAVPLRPGVSYVGRTKDNDITLESALLSRRHCKLICTDMGLTVHDLDSHNGVFINGKKVRSAPAAIGDLIYFADVVMRIEEGSPEREDEYAVESSLNKSSLVSQILKGEGADADDPAVKNLATLIQATDLLLGAGDDTFYPEIIDLCRELTEATLAVLVTAEDGKLNTPVVLREGNTPRGEEAPVSWSVVRKAIDEKVALFSKDMAADPLVPGDLLASGDVGALMCVPVIVDDEATGVIYLGRPFAGEGFSDREIETLSAVAHLVASRLKGGRPRVASLRGDGVDTAEGAPVEEMDGLRVQVEELQRECDRLRAELHGTSTEGGSLDAVESLKEELDAARKSLTNRERDLAKAHESLAKATREVEQLREESAAAQSAGATAAELSGQVADLSARLEDAHRSLEETEVARRAMVEQLQAAEAENEAKDNELAGLTAELGERTGEADTLRSQLAEAQAQASEAGAMGPLLEAALPVRLVSRLNAIAEGQTPDDALRAGTVTALCLAISGVDSWASQADPRQVQEILDRFAKAVRDRSRAHGGELEQVLGHAHLVFFPGDENGVRGALTCAADVVSAVPPSDAGAVQGGVHVAAGVTGFFGAGETAVYGQVGDAVAISRGACDYARPGAVYVTDAVHRFVADAEDITLIATGPHLIRGFMNPINLFQLGGVA